MDLELKTPDHTTLSRRNRRVEVPQVGRADEGPLHLCIDSTGLKRVGDGEWHAHKHRTSNKRRSWRKLHLGVAGSSIDDAPVGVTMIDAVRAAIGRFTADGAYDTRTIYEALAAAGEADIAIVVPPKKTAAPDPRAAGPWRLLHFGEPPCALKRMQGGVVGLGAKHPPATGLDGTARFATMVRSRHRAQLERPPSSLLVNSPLPCFWMPTKIHYCNHINVAVIYFEENSVRETIYDCASNAMVQDRESPRHLRHANEGGVDCIEKTTSQPIGL